MSKDFEKLCHAIDIEFRTWTATDSFSDGVLHTYQNIFDGKASKISLTDEQRDDIKKRIALVFSTKPDRACGYADDVKLKKIILSFENLASELEKSFSLMMDDVQNFIHLEGQYAEYKRKYTGSDSRRDIYSKDGSARALFQKSAFKGFIELTPYLVNTKSTLNNMGSNIAYKADGLMKEHARRIASDPLQPDESFAVLKTQMASYIEEEIKPKFDETVEEAKAERARLISKISDVKRSLVGVYDQQSEINSQFNAASSKTRHVVMATNILMAELEIAGLIAPNGQENDKVDVLTAPKTKLGQAV